MATSIPEVLPGVRRAPAPLAVGQRWAAALWDFCRRKPLGGISLAIIVFFIVVAIFAAMNAPYDPNRIYPRGVLADPMSRPVEGGAAFIFGGDIAGRDTFSRLVHGTRISFMVGVVATLIGLVVGTTLGLISGYFGGKLDMVLQRVIDSLMAFPGLILALLIMSLLGAELHNMMIAIGINLVPITTRLVRGTVLSVKQNAYIEAARAVGAGNTRIMIRHVLPNIMHVIIIVGAAFLAAAILIEASLSFLGVGVSPSTPTWGNMISSSRAYMLAHPALLWAPAGALSLLVLSFNLLGDAVRDVWDPRLRGT